MSAEISVIIPAYNAETTIFSTIESCLSQTCPPAEIIVVDDGSTDNTGSIAKAIGNTTKVFRKENGGPASARNFGARKARGTWLAMLDADDLWHPTKLERRIIHSDASDIGLIHCFAQHSNIDTPEFLSFELLWKNNYIINPSVLIRKSAFLELGGFDEDPNLISAEDYNLWLRLAASRWKIKTCREILVNYRRGVGISSNIKKFYSACLCNIDKLSKCMPISTKSANNKRLEIYTAFGDAARYENDLQLARDAYLHAIRIKPSIKNLAKLAVCHPPFATIFARPQSTKSIDDGILAPPKTQQADQHGIEFNGKGPWLSVIVDTEEEFDWRTVPSNSIRVESLKNQHLTQRIFELNGIVPTYAVDYAVASQTTQHRPLLEFVQSGQCEIGTHLHPWINPPITEGLTPKNSFPGNLPSQLEFDKLNLLTDVIERNFGKRPILYRAGRYGFGSNTPSALKKLGYKIDCSILPLFDLRGMEGPDFRKSRPWPHWLDAQHQLMELPVTVGLVGALSSFGGHLHPLISGPREESMLLPGIFARLNLINRVRLTPEGITLREAKQLTRSLLNEHGRQVFVLSYHSPSLQPGNTPYVRTDADLRNFLYWIEAFIDFFLSEIGGQPTTPAKLLSSIRK